MEPESAFVENATCQSCQDERRDVEEELPCSDPIPADDESSDSNVFMAVAVCIFLLLAITWVFGKTHEYGFVNYDDNVYVYENPPVMAGLTARGIGWAFTTTQCSNWHPLTWLSHMLDCQLYGLNAGRHRVTNIVLHAATVVFLFVVLWRMTGDLWPSAFAAAVFAIHPLRVESVVWVAERKDVLSGLFFMLTLGAYVGYVRRPGRPLWYWMTVALFALGLMCKPMLVTLPCVLLLLDYWPLRRVGFLETPLEAAGLSSTPWRLVVEKLPLFALSLVSCIITPLAQGRALTDLEMIPFSWRVTNAVVAYVTYMGQFFYPVNLVAFYPHPQDTLPHWQIVGALLLLLGISIAVWMGRRKYPYLLVGWLWYLGMLVPVIGIMQVSDQAMANRYTYLPQIGLGIALAWGVKELFGTWPYRAWVAGAGAVILLAALMGCARHQTSFWYDSETLWNHTLAYTTNNAVAHHNLGCVLVDQDDLDGARKEFEKAVECNPKIWLARKNLAGALQRQGHVAEAIAEYRQAIHDCPHPSDIHFRLGGVFAQQGKFDAALAEYERAVELEPRHLEARYYLGRVYHKFGRNAEAIAQWNDLLQLQPDHIPALMHLAWMLATSPDASIRNGGKAVELAERAAQLTAHRDPSILDILAAAQAEIGHFSDAAAIAARAMHLAAGQNNMELAKGLQMRLELYRKETPFRDTKYPPLPSSDHP